jgi:preprotein translocase subunit SecE
MELQKSEQSGPRFDTPLLVVALAVLLGGMVAFYYFDPQLGKIPRLLILLASVAVSVFMVSRTGTGSTIAAYLKGANDERRKVVWPTWPDSRNTTLVIAVFVVIVALIMWALDSALLAGVQYLTGRSA